MEEEEGLALDGACCWRRLDARVDLIVEGFIAEVETKKENSTTSEAKY